MNENNAFESLKLLDKFSSFGEKCMPNGTRLIGKALHIAPMAWSHAIFPALNVDEIRDFELSLHTNLPESYRDFLLQFNGLKVFCGTLSLYGKRTNYKRTVEESLSQPFNMITANSFEKHKNATDNQLIIGGYKFDRSRLYIDKNTNKVHFCKENDITSKYEWKDFPTMLASELVRLISLFSADGRILSSTEHTLPA